MGWPSSLFRGSVGQIREEHTVAAPVDGTVEAVRFAVGDLVEEGAELITLAEPRAGG